MKIELILLTTYLCIGSFVAGREYENDDPREGWPLKIARAFGRIFAYPIMWVLYKILVVVFGFLSKQIFLVHWIELWRGEFDHGDKEKLQAVYELGKEEFKKFNRVQKFFANLLQNEIFRRNDFTPKE